MTHLLVMYSFRVEGDSSNYHGMATVAVPGPVTGKEMFRIRETLQDKREEAEGCPVELSFTGVFPLEGP